LLVVVAEDLQHKIPPLAVVEVVLVDIYQEQLHFLDHLVLVLLLVVVVIEVVVHQIIRQDKQEHHHLLLFQQGL
jgi:hypothetical protein